MEQKNVGLFISRLRKKKGLTQETFGNELGVTSKTVSKWETGLNMPDISLLPKIADIFDITVDELLSCKIKDKHKSKLIKNIISACVIIIVFILISCSSYYICKKHYKFNIYKIVSSSKEYQLDGYLAQNADNDILVINHIYLDFDDIADDTMISSIEYEIDSGNKLIETYSYTYDKDESLYDMINNFQTLIYTEHNGEEKRIIDRNNLMLKISYIENGTLYMKLLKIDSI